MTTPTSGNALDAVLYEVRERVATLTLNRPQALNALNPALVEALLAASSRAAADAGVRAVIVRGAGEHFMAGGDLKWFHQQTREAAGVCASRTGELIGAVQQAVHSFQAMDKPVVAAVHGAVAGFGLSLMLAADLVLAADNAYFTLAYSKIALSPDGGATWSLARHVGLKQAMEIALLGERFDAQRARDLGLVNRLVAAEELDGEARKLAERLAAGPAAALARTKALLNASVERTLAAQLRAEQNDFAACVADPDFAEGLAAFFEKRRPVYRQD